MRHLILNVSFGDIVVKHLIAPLFAKWGASSSFCS